MVIDWDIQEAVWHEMETLRDTDSVRVGHTDVSTELVENFYGRATAREFTFESDEPTTMAGGENRGPHPLEYFLAGFALCQQDLYAKHAFATGIELTDLSIEVHGDVDPRGILGVGDVPPGFVDDELRYTVHIESPATGADIHRLVELAETNCPAHTSLSGTITFDRTVVLNGDPLDVDHQSV